jgi:maltose O-acetyltransferase
VYGNPAISIEGRVRIGNRVRFYSTVATLQLSVGPGALLEIEDNVVINYGTSLGVTLHVRIGARSRIGTNVMLVDSSFHYIDPARRAERPPSRPVVIGQNVWIAARAIILPGVTIGDNSVVAAGSIVTRDVPKDVVVAGSPAKPIRSVYDEQPR